MPLFFDNDNDGNYEETEALILLQNMGLTQEEAAAIWDQEATISSQALQNAAQQMINQKTGQFQDIVGILKNFASADTNDDGVVTLQELVDSLNAIRNNRAAEINHALGITTVPLIPQSTVDANKAKDWINDDQFLVDLLTAGFGGHDTYEKCYALFQGIDRPWMLDTAHYDLSDDA